MTFHGPVASSTPSDYSTEHLLAVLMDPRASYTIPMSAENDRRALDDAPLDPLRGWVDDELLSNGVFELTNRLARAVPGSIPTINRVSSRALGARRFTAPSHEVFVSRRRVRFVESEWAVPLEAVADVERVAVPAASGGR